MAREIELRENEEVLNEVKGDYCELVKQVRGKYYFTNLRILFRGGFTTEVSIDYSDIADYQPCNVGGIMPTGIKVTTTNGKKHRLSVLGRKKVIAFLEQHVTKG